MPNVSNDSRTALDAGEFYRRSCEAGFVKLEAIARNEAWTTETSWGPLEITINRSKPEKDPRAIAAAARTPRLQGETPHIDPATGRARSCPLCVEEADVACGYARRIRVCGEPWALWYSPYAYFEQHCIAMSWEHRPMHVDRAAFEGLLDCVDLVDGYFFGSNADLPIVGGSILSHDHFQGGRHVFPMQLAPVAERFDVTGAPDVEAGIVKWPLTVVRLSCTSRASLVAAACSALAAWQRFDDAEAGIASCTEGAPGRAPVRHNTITPIARRVAGRYEMDLALRCNVTSDEHPLGVFHPHEELHHIKRENIGLIEVMGLAILPPRVARTMEELSLTRDDVGRLFARVLEQAGVFKWDEPGRAALHRFLGSL